MAEIKNTFIQSKMNKDMDGRILPNGQYRDAMNVQISKSEGDDAGALENVLGNNLIEDWNLQLEGDNLEAIGALFDDTSNSMFIFITNYNDSSPSQLTNSCIGIAGVYCYIVSYNLNTNQGQVLVAGNFLNFSKTHLITGIDLLENLLFFTDNRNQPRKINIKLAAPGYYTTEDQISVAKYYPYSAPLLLEKDLNVIPGGSSIDRPLWKSTMKDVVNEYLPANTVGIIEAVDRPGADIYISGYHTNIKGESAGTVLKNGSLVTGVDIGNKVTVKEVVGYGIWNGVPITKLDLNSEGVQLQVLLDSLKEGMYLYFHFQNPEYNKNWPGDPDYLKDRFVRFSYRFKFADGEHSLSAPFTQIAFVPEQDGYFIGYNAKGIKADPTDSLSTLVGDESAAFDSTIVDFMENKVNDINICLLSPTKGNNGDHYTWAETISELKIDSVDILYREAGSNQINIVETIDKSQFTTNTTENLFYNYQSRKPWKTLPESETTRVFDAVPIRALSQSVSSNRIIYGNFIDKHTSPGFLNYKINIGEKPVLPIYNSPALSKANPDLFVRKEYQNHTLKQNRTYQVGIILQDRYGRPSNVILSNVEVDSKSAALKGSTIFHDYKNIEDPIILDKYNNLTIPATTWPGDMLYITFNQIIPEVKLSDGYPGVYSVADGTLSDVIFGNFNNGTGIFPPNPNIPGCTDCTIEVAIKGNFISVLGTPAPTARLSLTVDCSTGVVISHEIVPGSSSEGWSNGIAWSVDWTVPVALPGCAIGWLDNYNFGGVAITPIDNPLGWYSYKVVIKQQEQEYYNIYLPGSLAGYPCNQTGGIEGAGWGTNNLPIKVTKTPAAAGDESIEQELGNIKNTFFPQNAYNNTSHIVLFGDNINKVPKDLQDVGPTQAEFRCNEILYPRVESFLLQVDADQTYSSHQYTPPRLGDKVVTLGSMTDLGLGDLTTTPSAPVIPNLFYKGDTNPLIGRLSTDKEFGIRCGGLTAQGGINPCKSTVQQVSIDGSDVDVSTAANTQYAFGPTLAVCETKPVESLIDIFWETTTSGLVSELNYNIQFADNTIPTSINAEISWSEADDFGTVISNTFQAFGTTGNPLGASVDIELVSVVDQLSTDFTPKFVLNSLGLGQYELIIAPANYSSSKNFICDANPAKNEYTFKFKVTDTNTGNIIFLETNGQISNRAPNDRTTPSRDVLKDQICDSSFQYNLGENSSAGNPTISVGQAAEMIPKYGTPKQGWNTSYYLYERTLFPDENYEKWGYKPFFGENMANSTLLEWGFSQGQPASGPIDTQWSKNAAGAVGFTALHGFPFATGKLKDIDMVSYPMQTYSPTVYGFYGGLGNGWTSTTGSATTLDGVLKGTLQVGTVVSGDTTTYPRVEGNGDDSIPGGNNNWDYWSTLASQASSMTCGGGYPDPYMFYYYIQDAFNFTTTNGTYGSDFTESAPFYNQWSPTQPGDNGLGDQIEWSIRRMYQVSTYIPYDAGQPGGGNSGNPWSNCATAANLSGQITNVQGINWSVGEFVFGLYQDIIADEWSAYYGGDLPDWVKYLPDSPIYFYNDENQVVEESTVGLNYNKRGDLLQPTLDYPHHYWPDLNSILQNTDGCGDVIKNFRESNGTTQVPKMMQIQNGANSFYQFSPFFAELNYDQIPQDWAQAQPNGFRDIFALAIGLGETKYCGKIWNPINDLKNGTLQNARGFGHWTHGIDPTTKLGPVNNPAKFIMQDKGVNSEGFRMGKICAATTGQSSNTGIGGTYSTGYLGQSGGGRMLPGGRYVVTVRATDKSGASDGLWYEWDVPIKIPVWRWRNNAYGYCSTSSFYQFGWNVFLGGYPNTK